MLTNWLWPMSSSQRSFSLPSVGYIEIPIYRFWSTRLLTNWLWPATGPERRFLSEPGQIQSRYTAKSAIVLHVTGRYSQRYILMRIADKPTGRSQSREMEWKLCVLFGNQFHCALAMYHQR